MKVLPAFISAGFATFAAACTNHPTTPTPTTSRAALTTFPNLDGFVLVNSHDYDVKEHTGTTEKFSTADGIRCSVNGYTAMSCSAPFALPGTSAGSTDSSSSRALTKRNTASSCSRHAAGLSDASPGNCSIAGAGVPGREKKVT